MYIRARKNPSQSEHNKGYAVFGSRLLCRWRAKNIKLHYEDCSDHGEGDHIDANEQKKAAPRDAADENGLFD